jgi:hypothetical protein
MLSIYPNLALDDNSLESSLQNDMTAFTELHDILLFAARPNPYNIGNCYHYKNCQGESIGNMWINVPDYCKPIGGKSWKNHEGRCFNFPDGQQPLDPSDFVENCKIWYF